VVESIPYKRVKLYRWLGRREGTKGGKNIENSTYIREEGDRV